MSDRELKLGVMLGDDIGLEVVNGVVTLTGRLPADLDHRSVMDRIAQVPGVVGITDRLTD